MKNRGITNKFLRSVAGLSGALLCSTSLASITNSFNSQALADTYAQSCAQKMVSRADRTPDAADHKAPAYFQKSDGKWTYYSPFLTPQNREEAQNMVRQVPPHLKNIIFSEGSSFVFTRRSVVEAMPSLLSQNPVYWTEASAMYYAPDKRMTVTFAKAIGGLSPQTNEFEVFKYEEKNGRPENSLYHEMGHMVDDIAGDYSNANDPETRITSTPSMIAAYEQDVRHFKNLWRGNAPPEVIRDVSYLLPATYNSAPIGGDHKDMETARREAFAESFAQIHGHNKRNARLYLPRTYKYAKSVDTMLRRQYRQSGIDCQFGMK